MSETADLLERFRRGAELVAIATTGAAGTELDFTPGEGKWSVRTIVCHLADAETVFAMRFRQMLAENHPTMQGWNQNNWAAHLDYGKRKISQALDSFRRVRGENYDLLKDLPESGFARTGHHTERGEISVLDLLRIGAQHAETHVKQIQTTRAAYKEHKAKLASAPASAQ